MKRDWVVWLGCILLFGSGVVWGSVHLKTDFFVVSNVHDLFDIFGAIATVVAVCVAAVGLNSWKSQIRSSADHELARAISVSLLRYKAQVENIWDCASSAHARLDYKVQLGGSLKERVEQNIQSDINAAQAARVEFQGLILESKAAWGDLLNADAERLVEFEGRCCRCAQKYLKFFMYDGALGRYGLSKSHAEVVKSWQWFEQNELDSRDGAVQYLDRVVMSVFDALRAKRI
ncbi:hypothetical protein P3R38_09120 [Pseudomonas sp. NyZ480]|uniref:hypothetical protein n=1 Tax=Pseudomonas sp. NyZ480 TaxID=3035289 RepID=UPI00240A999D|nr:hypothetical protein [Pseudomonas sp. NyZ480]WEZ90403.1 hypothetical protein P3R38_09120 [Pseudomonas sp. NyZ480]